MTKARVPVTDDALVEKVAQTGAIIFRRADVMSTVQRHRHRTKAAKDLAEEQGRDADAEMCRVRLRVISSLMDDLRHRVPSFTNAAPAAIRERGE